MSASAAHGPAATAARERPPAAFAGPVAWLRRNLFNSWWSSAVTILLGYLLVRFAAGIIDWAFINAIWTLPPTANPLDTAMPCRRLEGAGACWAMVGDKYRFMLFGRFPYDMQWRPAVCVLLFIGLYGVSANRRFWRKELLWIWAATLAVIAVLMWGGVLGMAYVPQDQWGGLPITLILATFGLAFAFPLALVVGLGRRSAEMPVVRMLCIGYVELIRGVPLISLLFMASVMFPLFMPEGLNPDKLLRAQIAIILFAAAYLAEVVRAGLQALPKGQYEAADALGLSYWQKTRTIVLPQALRMVIPPLVNTFIGFFKDTSLVLIIGIFDLLTAGKVAMADPVWSGFSTEIYVVLALIYFVFCYAMSSYSRGLEKQFGQSKNR